MGDKKEPISEGMFGLSVTGKILMATLGAWLVGKAVNTKIKGSQRDIETLANSLISTRRFQDELRSPGATVESVMEKLRVKQMSSSEFERTFGIPWPL